MAGDEDETFPASLPETDRLRWYKMTASQREKAAERLVAFDAWSIGKMSIDEAVEASKLSRSRFYRLAADWRMTRSLSALGAFAGSGATGRSRLDPEAVNALQSVVPAVVRLNAGASVNQLVRLMVEQANAPNEFLPNELRLREIVENEIRRVAATGEAGHAVRFDCTAINLPQRDGRPYIMFVVLDTGTQAIFGAAVLSVPQAADGYRLAAIDARARIASTLIHLPWSLRLTRVELVAGADIPESSKLVGILIKAGINANVQLASGPKRFGRYFRNVIGDRIGRISITPGRTERGDAMPHNGDMTPWAIEDARAALSQVVDQHNDEVVLRYPGLDGTAPPRDLIETLVKLSSGMRADT